MSEEQITTTAPEAPSAPSAEAPAATPAAAPAAPAPSQPSAAAKAPAAAPAAPAKPVARTDTLREAMIAKGIIKPKAATPAAAPQGQQPRDAHGKFVSPTSSSSTVAATPPVAQAAVTNIAAALPRSLRKEYEAHWKAAHPELQKAWTQRDSDYERGIAGYRSRAEAGDALLAELKPYENVMRQTGTDARSMIRNLMPVAAVLATGTQQQKIAVVNQVLQQYGLSPEMFTGQAAAQAAQGVPAIESHPLVQNLMRQVQQLSQTVNSGQERSRAAEDQRIAAIAQAYGRDKPNFEALRPQMWSLLQAQAQAESQGLPGPLGSQQDTALWSEQQWIENAYNASLRLDPTHFQAELARSRDEAARAEREQANNAAQAARAAAVQVRGAPAGPAASTQAANPRDRRSVIAAAMRTHIS